MSEIRYFSHSNGSCRYLTQNYTAGISISISIRYVCEGNRRRQCSRLLAAALAAVLHQRCASMLLLKRERPLKY